MPCRRKASPECPGVIPGNGSTAIPRPFQGPWRISRPSRRGPISISFSEPRVPCPSTQTTLCSRASIWIRLICRAKSCCNGPPRIGSTARIGARTVSRWGPTGPQVDITWARCRRQDNGFAWKCPRAWLVWKAPPSTGCPSCCPTAVQPGITRVSMSRRRLQAARRRPSPPMPCRRSLLLRLIRLSG